MGKGKIAKCKRCGKEWLQLEISNEQLDHIQNDLQEEFTTDSGVCPKCKSTEYEIIPDVNILWD